MRIVHRLRHRWEAFAASTGLRLLPPVGAALAVLAAGVLLPFMPRVDALPPQLAPTLADARLVRFFRKHPDLPESGPQGAIYATRPAFYWPERAGAESYAFRLFRGEGTEQAAATGLVRTFHLVPPPGFLPPGEYRFEVTALVKGESLPWREHRFSVRPPPEELRKLLRSLGTDLAAPESSYVLLGYYADLESPHDVISAFLQWKAARGEAGSLGSGPPAAWLAPLR